MTPDQFKQWRKEMGYSSQEQAARALGLSKDAVVNYESGIRRGKGTPIKIPRPVALACTALYHKLEPWGD